MIFVMQTSYHGTSRWWRETGTLLVILKLKCVMDDKETGSASDESDTLTRMSLRSIR
jgi:hypothetical protein